MPLIYLILMFLLASWSVTVFIPNKGWAAYVASMVIVGGFLSLVMLTKLVILL